MEHKNLKRNLNIGFRVDDSEKRFLEKKIAKSGKNVREYFLSLAKEQKIYNIENIEDLQAIYSELLKEGTNINQIAKALNSNKDANLKQIGRILKKHEVILDILAQKLVEIKN